MVDRNTSIVNRSPQTAERFEKTSNSLSPQMQKCDIQEIDDSEDDHQTRKIYQIQNSGTVYMDSFNVHGVRMENCSNNVPQVTYDHRPRIIGNERVLFSQSHAVSDGPQKATGPPDPRASTEIRVAESLSKASNVHLQTSALSPPVPQSPQPILPSHFCGDHTHNLEQLLDSSLATVAVIQFSGSTMADVLTPRAYDTIKALYALAALDAAASKPRGSEVPTRSTFSDNLKGDDLDCPYSCTSNPSPPLPNSSLAVPRTVRMHGHVSISVDYVVLISWAGLVAVFCVGVFFNCLGFAKGSS